MNHVCKFYPIMESEWVDEGKLVFSAGGHFSRIKIDYTKGKKRFWFCECGKTKWVKEK